MLWESIFRRQEDYQIFISRVRDWNQSRWDLGPRTATIMITGRCNYRCNYCLFRGFTYQKEMPAIFWKSIIDQLAGLGVTRILFTGGEPLLYESIWDLISYGRDCGLGVGLISNASLASRDVVDSLVNAGLSSFIVSLDTINHDLYSAMSSSSAATIENIIDSLLYVNKNVSCWAGIICVLTPQIIPGLLDLFEFCRKHKVSITLNPFLENGYISSLSVAEVKNVVDIIKKAVAAGTPIMNSISFIESMVWFAETRRLPEGVHCAVPFYEIHFTPDGKVKACCLSDVIGDAQHSSVKEIWESNNYKSWRRKAVDSICSNCLLSSHELMLQGQITSILSHERIE